ncbi:hypothetical protein OH458_21455 [Vibrio sp. MarTm2]|uniref:hypothetical protein n=1 Tax=Vibrio sp. MarTm2 TaxID=2998831 RepID=UPI0022CD278B|nr:hypothetical protein [Vibrio sp. MarTm2]MDA0130634.1 hypothetical protein [Vibrio sp. MarTm2]
MDKNILRDVAVWLAAGTGVLYILGNTYYISWLRTLGLSPSFLPKDTPQLLQIGFTPFYTFGLWAIVFSIPILGLLRVLAKHLFRLIVVIGQKLRPDSTKTWNREVTISVSVLPQSVSDFSETLEFVMNNLVFLFLLVVVYGCLGSWLAIDKLEDIKNRKEIVYQLGDAELSILTCSSITSLCAVYSYDDNQTSVIKMESLAGSVVISRPSGLYETLFFKSSDKKI